MMLDILQQVLSKYSIACYRIDSSMTTQDYHKQLTQLIKRSSKSQAILLVGTRQYQHICLGKYTKRIVEELSAIVIYDGLLDLDATHELYLQQLIQSKYYEQNNETSKVTLYRLFIEDSLEDRLFRIEVGDALESNIYSIASHFLDHHGYFLSERFLTYTNRKTLTQTFLGWPDFIRISYDFVLFISQHAKSICKKLSHGVIKVDEITNLEFWDLFLSKFLIQWKLIIFLM